MLQKSDTAGIVCVLDCPTAAMEVVWGIKTEITLDIQCEDCPGVQPELKLHDVKMLG
jgi:hypothetical protein